MRQQYDTAEVHVVRGPPGTGKTSRLKQLVEEAEAEFGSENVYVCSFTRAAANEIAGRGLPLKSENVGTLHSFCYRALERPEIAETRVKEWNEDHPGNWALTPLRVTAAEAEVEHHTRTEADKLLSQYQRLRNARIPRTGWPPQVTWFAERWEQFKRQIGAIDFTDMIEMCLGEERDLLPDADAVFVDEAQDLTPLELDLLNQVCRRTSRLVVAGDPYQSIYQFRGVRASLDLLPGVQVSQSEVLRHSYRLGEHIRLYGDRVLGRFGMKPDLYVAASQGGLTRRVPMATWRHVHDLLDHVMAQTAAGSSVMLLATCSYMLWPLVAEMRRRLIPYHNPYRPEQPQWNPLRAGYGGEVTKAILVLDTLSKISQGERLPLTAEDLWHLTKTLSVNGVFPRGQKRQIEQMAQRAPEKEISLSMFSGWVEPGAFQAMSAGSLEWYEEHVLPSLKYHADYILGLARAKGIDVLRSEPLVIVGTLHSVKGDQADVVCLFPDLSPAGMDEYMGYPQQREGIGRLFYVGVTRARKAVYLCSELGRYAVDLPPPVLSVTGDF